MTKRNLLLCSILVSWLCYAQASGSRILLLPCLAAFLLFTAAAAVQKYELPVLLFFLPWSELLKTAPGSISFYTLALLLVCLIQIFRKKFRFQSYYVGITLLLILSTLLSKILSGYRIENSYLMLMVMFAVYPMIGFFDTRYDFCDLSMFFSVGIIIAALTAQALASSANIGRFIRVDSYLTVTRRCGYYSDPNFYVAQITAALAGNMLLITRERRKGMTSVLLLLSGILVYCGFLSGSKSFALIFILLTMLWLADILIAREIITKKLVLLGCIAIFLLYVLVTPLFQDKIDVILTRLSWSNNASGFTTGRIELWKNYFREIMEHFRILIIGQGFTDVISGPKASHNTLLQLVYQFGLFGGGLIAAWFAGLYRDVLGLNRLADKKILCIVILMAGTILPWMAIDILFFNELFLIPTYLFIGLREWCVC